MTFRRMDQMSNGAVRNPGFVKSMAAAVAFSAVLIPLFVWLAATVYKRGILHTGSRMTLKQALGRG